MFKRIIISLCVILVLIGAVFAGNAVLKTYQSDSRQSTVLTEQKESSLKQSEISTPEVKTTEETVINDFDEPKEKIVSEEIISDNRLTCTLSVNCSSVLNNIHKLKDDKKDLIPKDGIILKEIEVEFFPDESVFDVLYRELKNNNIHFEFVKTPAYNSVYIEGIANLYEFDCGELSGWLYRVNGIKPTYGSSQYKVNNNDRIEFFYSCDMFK